MGFRSGRWGWICLFAVFVLWFDKLGCGGRGIVVRGGEEYVSGSGREEKLCTRARRK